MLIIIILEETDHNFFHFSIHVKLSGQICSGWNREVQKKWSKIVNKDTYTTGACWWTPGESLQNCNTSKKNIATFMPSAQNSPKIFSVSTTNQNLVALWPLYFSVRLTISATHLRHILEYNSSITANYLPLQFQKNNKFDLHFGFRKKFLRKVDEGN